jgi:carboxypeptidase C (cathepsin A)
MTLSPNPNRFTNTANLMFIDLPGSGFSFATNASLLPTDAKTFGVQLTQAINFFIQESVLGQSSKLVIGG